MDIYTIYKATNTVNGKVYIGFDSNWPSRQQQHLIESAADDPEDGSIFHKALRKYGSSAFTWVVLCQSRDGEHLLNEKEGYYIELYNSHYIEGYGYNMTYGGEGTLGRVHTKKTRKKISESKKNRPRTLKEQEFMKRLNESKRGVPQTQAHKEKRAAALMGHETPQETREKISKSLTGKKKGPLSKETKQKISVANTGRPSPLRGTKQSKDLIEKRTHTQTKKTKKKISQALEGKPKSAAHKENLRKAWELRRQRMNHINI
jgi:group I intron endonuclease